jgi:hypothetical protein
MPKNSFLKKLDDGARRIHARKNLIWPDKGYHPSSMEEETCPRFLVYKRLGAVPKAIPPRVLRIFAVGTEIGNIVQEHMIEGGILKSYMIEAPIHGPKSHKRIIYPGDYLGELDKAAGRAKQYLLRGNMDGFDPFYEDGPTVYEIKSCKDSVYNSLQGPQLKHIVQASLYAWATRSVWIVFIYWNKDTQDLKVFRGRPDKKLVERCLEDITVAQDFLRMEELPPRHEGCPNKSTKKARYCPFGPVCFSNAEFQECDNRSPENGPGG